MHGHTNVKKKYVQILTHRVKFEKPLEISREICPPVGSTGIISVRYQLPLFCWSVNVYKGLSRKMKSILGVSAWTKCWETLT